MLSGKDVPESNSNLYHGVTFSSWHINRLIVKNSSEYFSISVWTKILCCSNFTENGCEKNEREA